MAGSNGRVDELLARLRPWLPALKILRPSFDWIPQERHDPDERLVVLLDGRYLVQEAIQPVPIDRVCEALSLLTLVARGDIKSCRALVSGIWQSHWLEPRKFKETLLKKCVFGFELSDVRPDWINNLYRFCNHLTSRAPPSPAYRSMFQFLKNELSIQCADGDPGLRIPVRIEMDCGDTADKTAGDMLRCALDLVDTEASFQTDHTNNSRVTNHTRPRFTITNVDFATTIGVHLDKYAFGCLLQLRKRGMPITHLPPLKMEPSTTVLPKFVQIRRDLTGLDGGVKRKRGVPTISINDDYSGVAVMHALLTAAHTVHIPGQLRSMWGKRKTMPNPNSTKVICGSGSHSAFSVAMRTTISTRWS